MASAMVIRAGATGASGGGVFGTARASHEPAARTSRAHWWGQFPISGSGRFAGKFAVIGRYFTRNTQFLKGTSWRRDRNSVSPASFRLCKLHKPHCQERQECQRCRGALLLFAPCTRSFLKVHAWKLIRWRSVGYSPLLSISGAGCHDVCGKTLDAFGKRTLLRREFDNHDQSGF
jgi:hypothetical protein